MLQAAEVTRCKRNDELIRTLQAASQSALAPD